MKFRIVGMDPSMLNWGMVAAQVEFDAIGAFDIKITDMTVSQKEEADKTTKRQVRKNSLDIARAAELHGAVNAFVKTHQPSFVMVEVPHGSKSASGMKSYGMCVGVLGSIDVPLVEVTEAENKLASVGKKGASKKEMIAWAMAQHPEAPWKMQKKKGELISVDGYNEHLADAIGAIYAGIYSPLFQATIQMTRSMKDIAI